MIKRVFRLGLMLALVAQCSQASVFWPLDFLGDVNSEDVIINGDLVLPVGNTTIAAVTNDITVTFAAAGLLSGSAFGPSILTFLVEYPYTITIHVDNDATFIGSPGTLTQPLIILEQANIGVGFFPNTGTIIWDVKKGCTLSFTSGDDGNSGVELYLDYSSQASDAVLPEHVFRAHHKEAIHFGRHCKFGYKIAQSPFLPLGTYSPLATFRAWDVKHHNTELSMHDGSAFVLQDVGS
jgi:hypothetical protein